MRMSTHAIDPDDERVVHEPMVRLSLVGCSLPECNCSNTPFLMVTNGEVVISVELDPADIDQLRAAADGRDRCELT
jgi:hypothetical protein